MQEKRYDIIFLRSQYFCLFVSGCGTLWSLDGNWKITYPICMYTVARSGQVFGGKLKYITSCPNQPMTGMAFCNEHCRMAEKQGFPTDLHGYRKHEKMSKSTAKPATTNQMQQKTAADCQGASCYVVHGMISHKCVQVLQQYCKHILGYLQQLITLMKMRPQRHPAIKIQEGRRLCRNGREVTCL